MKEHFLSDNLRDAFIDSLDEKFKNNEIDFKQSIDEYKSIKDSDTDPCLYELLYNKELFEELSKNNRLSREDLKYLLNKIAKIYELERLCRNTPLIKSILNEFILNIEDVDKFNEIVEEIDWCKNRNMHTIFDLIEDWYKNNEEVLKLNDLNRFDLHEDQRLELTELIKNNEIARNRMIEVVDNKLEFNYSFDSLMNYLKKKKRRVY